ncbi:MAG: ribonuclease P protein component [Bacteroidales bacterium]|nr:ribonuclease P protein component [Bacteroidales bacterium]
MTDFSFSKDEILRRKKRIDQLFKEGSSFFVYPCKVYWLITPLDTSHPAQVMFIAGKKNFRHAVDRNRIRRQIRETYRLQKHQLYDYLNGIERQCLLCIIYTAKTPPQRGEMDRKINTIFKRLFFEINRNLNNPPAILST